MATITSSTGASGLAIESIVSGLMSIERQPLTTIRNQISAYNTKVSAFGTLKSGLSTFQTALDKLATPSKFNAQTVNLSDTSSLTATANGSASKGTYSLAVSQLASSQKLATNAYASTASVIGTGTLTISFGAFTPANATAGTAASFDANTAKTPITVEITSGNNSLTGVRDAINAQNASVSASIVNDGTGNRLVITSKDTGAVNSLKIDVVDADGDATDASGLSSLAFDPLASAGSGQNMTQLVAANNALMTVDGLAISKASNTITDVIEGLTLNLKTITAAPMTLEVATDTNAIKESVKSFVDAYNSLTTSMGNLTRFVEGGSSANGPLLGDASVRTISTRLRAMMSQQSTTATTFKSLNDIGIAFGQDGKLAINNDRLDTAMATNLADIGKLFGPSAVATDSQVSYVSSSSLTKPGVYPVNITQLAGTGSGNVAGTVNGVNASGEGSVLTVSTEDNSRGLKLNIGGTTLGSRGTVTFSLGLAGDLSSQITEWLEANGPVQSKTDGLQTSIKALNKKSDALSAKLPAIEARYRAQYSRLDALLASMQSTSSYLAQQINALNNSG